jgi:hypothetical protein
VGEEIINSRFAFVPKLIEKFKQTGYDLQTKFEHLTEELLRNTFDSGTRVLHVASDCFARDCIFIESQELGVCKRLNIQMIHKFMSKQQDKVIAVDCLVLAVPYSKTLGTQFY